MISLYLDIMISFYYNNVNNKQIKQFEKFSIKVLFIFWKSIKSLFDKSFSL